MDDTDIHDLFHHYPTLGEATLSIKKATDADIAVYSCRASNKAGRATCSANVVVVRKYIFHNFAA